MEGKKIRIYFDDGAKIAWKEGIATSQDAFSITLDGKIVIPRGRMVRMEVIENGTGTN